MFTLKCSVFSRSLPYCGFCVNLLQPAAWTGDTYIEYDIVIAITTLAWFSLTIRMRLRTLMRVRVQPILSDWGDQFLCNKILRHYEDNAFIILTGVSGCDWHWVHQPYGLDIWSELCALLLWGCLLTFHPEMRVGDYSGRYITTEQLYWADYIEDGYSASWFLSWEILSLCDELIWRWNLVFQRCLRVNVLRHTLIWSCSLEAMCCSETTV